MCGCLVFGVMKAVGVVKGEGSMLGRDLVSMRVVASCDLAVCERGLARASVSL